MSQYEQWLPGSVKYKNGLMVAVATNTTLTLSAGATLDATNQLDMVLTSAVTINAEANGANGLDTGTFAASKVYGVFLITDVNKNNPAAGLISLSLTSPTLPGGYSSYRRVGVAVSDGSTHFSTLYAYGENNTNVQYYYDTPIIALSAGTANTQTAVSLATQVPAIANMPVLLDCALTPNAASDTLTLYPSGSAGTSRNIMVGQVASVVERQQRIVPVTLISGLPKFDYALSTSSAAATIYVLGFTDTL